jgi:hypothetical protein
MWYLWWTKRHWYRFFSKYFCFSLVNIITQFSILNFIYTLLLPKGQTGEAWEPTKKQCHFVNREPLVLKVLSFTLWGVRHVPCGCVTWRRVQWRRSIVCEDPLGPETQILRLPHLVHYNTKVSSWNEKNISFHKSLREVKCRNVKTGK